MQMNPNKDTQLCMSLSGRPGNFGLRFHNHLYEQLGLNFYYKAFSSQDLPGAVGGIRALGIRGCGVSMPFKEACIELVDELDASAAAIQSINTIVNTDGHLKAYNTDYIAVAQLLEKHRVPKDSTFALRGSGGRGVEFIHQGNAGFLERHRHATATNPQGANAGNGTRQVLAGKGLVVKVQAQLFIQMIVKTQAKVPGAS